MHFSQNVECILVSVIMKRKIRKCDVRTDLRTNAQIKFLYYTLVGEGWRNCLKYLKRGQNIKKPLVNYASTNLTNYDYVHIKSLHSNCYDYVLRISEFPDLFGNVFLISYRFSLFDFSIRYILYKEQ